MIGKTAVELAAEFAVGSITADIIREKYGDSILTEVLSIAGGLASAGVTSLILDVVDRNTGIVSDLGSLVDDVFDIF